MADKRKTDLFKNTSLLTICTILNKVFGFILVPLFSRWLTTEEYGTYDVLASYASLLVPIVTVACADALFRFCIEEDSDKQQFTTNAVVLTISNLLILGVIFLIISKFVYYKYFGYLYILLYAECIDNVVQGYLRGIKRLDIYGYCKAVGILLIGGFTALLVLGFELGSLGITLGYTIGYLLSDIIAIMITRIWNYINIRKVSKKIIKKMLDYSWVLVPNSLSWWVMNASDRLFISFFLTPADNGIYAIASKVPTVCSSIFSVFSITWQQTSTEMINDKEKDSYFNEIFNKMICLLVTLCAGILSINYFLFHFVFDSNYAEGQLYSPILITSAIFLSISQYFGGIEIALKRPKENSITTIIGAVVNIIIDIMLMRFIGLYAAALSTLIAYIVVMLSRWIRLAKVIKLQINKNILPLSVFYLYIFICSIINPNIIIIVINMLLTGVVFIVANRNLVTSIVSNIKRNIHKFRVNEV